MLRRLVANGSLPKVLEERPKAVAEIVGHLFACAEELLAADCTLEIIWKVDVRVRSLGDFGCKVWCGGGSRHKNRPGLPSLRRSAFNVGAAFGWDARETVFARW